MAASVAREAWTRASPSAAAGRVPALPCHAPCYFGTLSPAAFRASFRSRHSSQKAEVGAAERTVRPSASSLVSPH